MTDETKTTFEIALNYENECKHMMALCGDISDVRARATKERWCRADEETEEALALYRHLKAHSEVINAPINAGIPICRICGKSAIELARLVRED